MNHRRAARFNAPSACRAQPQVRFRGEADIDRQAKLAGSVENDPKRSLVRAQIATPSLPTSTGLSRSIQHKASHTLWRNPGIGLFDLLDKVEPQLTLAEAHEAEAWLRSLKGCRVTRGGYTFPGPRTETVRYTTMSPEPFKDIWR